MMRNKMKFAIVGLAIGVCATGGAWAQAAAPAAPEPAAAADDAAKAKPKRRPGKPVINVVVTNSRGVGLVELDAAISGGDGKSVKIAGPLAAGKKSVAHLKHDKACQFDLHGTFDDGTTTDNSGVELCKDRKINLVE